MNKLGFGIDIRIDTGIDTHTGIDSYTREFGIGTDRSTKREFGIGMSMPGSGIRIDTNTGFDTDTGIDTGIGIRIDSHRGFGIRIGMSREFDMNRGSDMILVGTNKFDQDTQFAHILILGPHNVVLSYQDNRMFPALD